MANYSTDRDLEKLIPDILDLGLPDLVNNGLETKVNGDHASGVTVIKFQDTTGIVEGEHFRIGAGPNAEILTVQSLSDPNVTFTTASVKVHKTNTKVEQVLEDGFANEHALAKTDIDRRIETRWFLPQVQSRFEEITILTDSKLFDPTLMLDTANELTELSAYWTLGYYVFPKLARKRPEEDYFTRQTELFVEKANAEFEHVLARGISYDWDESGALSDWEKREPGGGFILRRH